MRRFACAVVPDPGTRVRLDAEVSRHLLQVTRVPRGGEVVLFDGRGRSAVARLVAVQGDCAELEVLSLEQAQAPTAALWACLAVTKGSRFETAIRMAVELGATRIVPVLAGRSIARGDRRARWQRVIDGAVSQSGRAFEPELAAMVSLGAVLKLPSPEFLRWMCVPGAAPVSGSLGPAAVLVGPEGGWTEREVATAREAGWHEAGLGTTVLRAETAVASALTRVRCAGPASV
jgi:16S rRNA (uracil1498-N3)-methyltransferase